MIVLPSVDSVEVESEMSSDDGNGHGSATIYLGDEDISDLVKKFYDTESSPLKYSWTWTSDTGWRKTDNEP